MKEEQDTILFKSGDFFLPRGIVDFLDKYIIGQDDSVMYINYWSIIHMLSGMLVTVVITDPLYALLIHTLWELWQIFIKMTHLNKRGVIDISIDTVMFMLGFFILKN